MPQCTSELANELCTTEQLLTTILPSNGKNELREQVEEDLELEGEHVSHDEEENRMKYLVGYIAHFYRNKYPELTEKSDLKEIDMPTWIEIVSRGHLVHPSDNLLQGIEKVEQYFLKFHGPYLNHQLGSITKIYAAIFTVNCSQNKNVIFTVRQSQMFSLK